MKPRSNIVKESFSSEILYQDQALLQKCCLYQRWLQRSMLAFEVNEVRFLTSLIVQREGLPHVLFLQIEVKAKHSVGGEFTNTLFLRGEAVGVLVVLNCLDKKYTLLVEQPRLGPGVKWCAEIPAGMLDNNENVVEVAIKELKEETGLDVKSNEVKPLQMNGLSGSESFSVSVGASDERIHLYYIERSLSTSELNELEGQIHGCAQENETIRLSVCVFEDAPKRMTDGKSLQAWMRYKLLGKSTDVIKN